MISDAELEELSELEKGATPEPWQAGRKDMRSFDFEGIEFKNIYFPSQGEESDEHIRCYTSHPIEDSQFIALSRNKMRSLLEEVKHLRECMDHNKPATLPMYILSIRENER